MVGLGDHEEGVLALHALAVGVHVRQALAGIGAGDPHGLELARAEVAEHLDGGRAGLGLDAAGGHAPELLHVLAVLVVGDHPSVGQQVAEQAAVAHAAAGVGLAGEREGGGAGPVDLAGEQVQVVHQVVDPDAAGPLVQAHAPEAHGRLGLGEHPGRLDDLVLGTAGDLFGGLGGVIVQELHILVPGNLFGLRRRPGVGHGHEHRVLVHVFLAVEVLLDDHVGHGVQDGQVGAGGEAHVQVGDPRREGLAGIDHDDLGAALLLLVDDAEDDRVRLGHVRADDEEAVGVVHVVVGAHGLVLAEGGDVAHGGRGHAEPGVAVDVVGAEAALEQLVHKVGFLGKGLAGPVEGHGLGVGLVGLGELGDHEVHGLVPADPDELVAFSQQRVFEPVRRGHDRRQEVALEAEEPLVPVVLVALDGDDLAALDADIDAAARAAITADALYPLFDVASAAISSFGSVSSSPMADAAAMAAEYFSNCLLVIFISPLLARGTGFFLGGILHCHRVVIMAEETGPVLCGHFFLHVGHLRRHGSPGTGTGRVSAKILFRGPVADDALDIHQPVLSVAAIIFPGPRDTPRSPDHWISHAACRRQPRRSGGRAPAIPTLFFS